MFEVLTLYKSRTSQSISTVKLDYTIESSKNNRKKLKIKWSNKKKISSICVEAVVTMVESLNTMCEPLGSIPRSTCVCTRTYTQLILWGPMILNTAPTIKTLPSNILLIF